MDQGPFLGVVNQYRESVEEALDPLGGGADLQEALPGLEFPLEQRRDLEAELGRRLGQLDVQGLVGEPVKGAGVSLAQVPEPFEILLGGDLNVEQIVQPLGPALEVRRGSGDQLPEPEAPLASHYYGGAALGERHHGLHRRHATDRAPVGWLGGEAGWKEAEAAVSGGYVRKQLPVAGLEHMQR